MKRNTTSQPVLVIIGLLFSVLLPLTLRDHLPDFVKGMLTGVGIGLLILAVVRTHRQTNRV